MERSVVIQKLRSIVDPTPLFISLVDKLETLCFQKPSYQRLSGQVYIYIFKQCAPYMYGTTGHAIALATSVEEAIDIIVQEAYALANLIDLKMAIDSEIVSMFRRPLKKVLNARLKYDEWSSHTLDDSEFESVTGVSKHVTDALIYDLCSFIPNGADDRIELIRSSLQVSPVTIIPANCAVGVFQCGTTF